VCYRVWSGDKCEMFELYPYMVHGVMINGEWCGLRVSKSLIIAKG